MHFAASLKKCCWRKTLLASYNLPWKLFLPLKTNQEFLQEHSTLWKDAVHPAMKLSRPLIFLTRQVWRNNFISSQALPWRSGICIISIKKLYSCRKLRYAETCNTSFETFQPPFFLLHDIGIQWKTSLLHNNSCCLFGSDASLICKAHYTLTTMTYFFQKILHTSQDSTS